MAQVHGASDGATLFAASNKLVKLARTWYNIQSGVAIESWFGLKPELIKMFGKKVPFYKQMQRIEARKWSAGKETFDQYVIAKRSLMQTMDLPDRDVIHILIGGILQSTLRATALSIAVTPWMYSWTK